jgi:hypothetical protein
MSDESYRLVKIGNTFYYFEECEKGKFRYAIDYVANKSYSSLKDYEDFLKESNIRYIEKAGSIGKVSLGNVRYRPYADSRAKIATTDGMIKREFLILEKENDGKPFEIYTNIEDKIKTLKVMRKPTIAMIIFVGLMFLFSTGLIPQYQWTLYKFELFPKVNKIPLMIIFGVVEVLLAVNLIRYNMEINRLKRESEIRE